MLRLTVRPWCPSCGVCSKHLPTLHSSLTSGSVIVNTNNPAIEPLAILRALAGCRHHALVLEPLDHGDDDD